MTDLTLTPQALRQTVAGKRGTKIQALGRDSIRARILLGCLCLTLVTIIVSILSQNVAVRLTNSTLGIYDNAFMSMNFLRSAQTTVLQVSRDIARGEGNSEVSTAQLQSAMDALDVAKERAMSPTGRDAADLLHTAVASLQADCQFRALPQIRFKTVERQFDAAVSIYAADGFRLRRAAEAVVIDIRHQNYLAMVGSVLIAICITFFLNHAIVPPMRHAVKMAAAIAEGKLDNTIDCVGPVETRQLLNALASMQTSIASKIARIETLMAQQASSHAAEIAVQHSRFEAALNNMTHGLCMFDVDGQLLIQNQRFVDMFVTESKGLCRTKLFDNLHDASLGAAPRSGTAQTFHRSLANGRVIAVCEEPMEGGGRVVTYEDITERQRAEARLTHMARHDALTDLPNRVLFREQVVLETTHIGLNVGLAVFCLDLDRFKTVNDTLGHSVGDSLLRETARRLRAALGERDMIVRLGGDEFAIVKYVSRPKEDSRSLADALLDAMKAPFHIDGHYINIGTSIGIAETWDRADTPDDLLKKADLALYSAKADGKGTFRFFEHEMQTKIETRRQLEQDLRSALTEQQFEVHYQPLVCASNGIVIAFEALLRWHHPKHGSISPVDFIPVAEEAGLISSLGVWVLNKACQDAMQWPAHIRVAVNLSPLQFRAGDLVSDVRNALQLSGLPARRLDLEITESLMLQDTDATLKILHDLRVLNVRISMDDFGTGFSSLSYLLKFPFDKIKIDKSFICNMHEGSDSVSIVRAIINLAQSLRIKVVAEGVETAAQMSLLRDAGCQELQGYFFSRPRPLAETADLVGRVEERGLSTSHGDGWHSDKLQFSEI